ncbi:MAG: hypothetical protein GY765_28220 [bacterium]|nr:hypothetical protein [bacterium]
MRRRIHQIQGKLTVEWESEAKAIIDTWDTYNVSLEEFKDAVLIKGVDCAKANGGRAWIVDSHKATGVFKAQIQKFIETDIFPKFAELGIKYFMTITSADAVTRLTINQYSAKAGPCGLKVLKGSCVEDALKWLIKNG